MLKNSHAVALRPLRPINIQSIHMVISRIWRQRFILCSFNKLADRHSDWESTHALHLMLAVCIFGY